MIYLDNAATTKVNKEVLETFIKLQNEYFMNANSFYKPAIKINNLQEKARLKLAETLRVEHQELIFTSCGSESNNMAIKGIAYKYLNKNKHIISSMVEHASVYETMQELEKQGFEVTYLKPNKYGCIDNQDVLDNIKPNTILISIMKVNSEIGSINNIEAIYNEIKTINKNISIHMDCVQAFGKLDLDLSKVDLASFSAHKINGLKGSGLLYKSNSINLIPLISGSIHEFKLRAGTSNYHTNIVLAKTLRLFLKQRDDNKIKDNFNFIYNLLDNNEYIKVNSNKETNSMYILNFSIPDFPSEVILNALEQQEIYVSTKSACSSRVKRSRVMNALDISDKLKDSAFRISFSNKTTQKELQTFYDALTSVLTYIRSNK